MKTSGQQVANSIYGGGSAMIAPVLVGVLEDGLGINPSLFAIAALALLPTVMMLFYHKKTEKVLSSTFNLPWSGYRPVRCIHSLLSGRTEYC